MQHPDAEHVISEIAATFMPPLKRIQRVLGYFLATAFFAHAVPYNIDHPWLIATGIGVLGGASQSARIGQASLFLFAAMAVIPKSFVMTVASVVGLG